MFIKVSIIIPVYNKSKYIERCINSVIYQTYQNIECLIVDDCGKELLVSKVMLFPNVDIVQGNTKRIPIGNNNYELQRFNFPDVYNNNESVRERFYDVWKTFPINAWNKLIRADFIREHNLFFLEGIIHEDEHWMSEVVKYCNSMTFEYGYTYNHYIEPNSIMTSTNNEKSGHSWGLLLYDIANHFEEKDFLRQYKRYLRDLAYWFSRAPHISSLRDAYKAFQKKALSHRMYYIASVLFISRHVFFFEFGRKAGRHLINLWIYRR